MTARYYCLDEERRATVRALANGLNGIDYLEVIDAAAPSEELRQRLLVIRCLRPVAGLERANVRIEGGVRVRDVKPLWAHPLAAPAAEIAHLPAPVRGFFTTHRAAADDRDHYLVVGTNSDGDFSRYRLLLHTAGEAPPGFDPRLTEVEFSFKVDCPDEFDCKPAAQCPPAQLDEPQIDYLAKDYASFRRLMLDRAATLVPDWDERNAADLGITLVELLAYVGDRLSYAQDAAATEAYLNTARRRTSVRRHARLVGYRMHEGAAARAWVQFEVDAAADGATLRGPDPATGRPGTALATRFDDAGPQRPLDELAGAIRTGAELFETMHDVTLRAALNRLEFHTWSDLECCLPAGATEATLRTGAVAGLEPGALLVFEEVKGPLTGEAADADPAHRHVVRLTRAVAATDLVDGTEVVEIAWDAADALPFPLCISARTDEAHGSRPVAGVSVARGNLVLCDHGRTVSGEAVGPVPEDAAGFLPTLAAGPLAHTVPLPQRFVPRPGDSLPPAPASSALAVAPALAAPAVELVEQGTGAVWRTQRDLLASDRFRSELVAEVDDLGVTHLRFGDDVFGKRPAAGTGFTARYRVGGGTAGNVGGEALGVVFADQPGILAVRNPLPAFAGAGAEPVAEVRQFAPHAFRVQERAVTEDDYARVAERHPEVQRAAATFRWTGSWHTVFVTVDRRGGLEVDGPFEEHIREHLDRYRMAGYDLEIDGPRFVPLDLELSVCVQPGFLGADVRRALLEVFSSRRLPDGRPGFFHPDQWSFGEPVFVSRIYAAAAAVAGVESVTVARFRRWGRPEDPEHLSQGYLPIERLEIARLDNDPSFRENGLLGVSVGGGR